MNIERCKEAIKRHEGEVLEIYIDSLGFKTLGVGHRHLSGSWTEQDVVVDAREGVQDGESSRVQFHCVFLWLL